MTDTQDEGVPEFSLDELEFKEPSKPKIKRIFSEVSPVFRASGFRRVHYNMDGSRCTGMVFRDVIHGLPVNGTFTGQQDVLMCVPDESDPTRTILFKWVNESVAIPPNRVPQLSISDLRYIGLNSKRQEMIIHAKDLKRSVPESWPVSRPVQVLTGAGSYCTFEWLDVRVTIKEANKKEEEE